MASGQGSSLKLAAAVKLLADYLFLTNEKVSALDYYKEALERVEARTEHDRAKPQTQSFSAQVVSHLSLLNFSWVCLFGGGGSWCGKRAKYVFVYPRF